jgi:LacI family transcriptional regulator
VRSASATCSAAGPRAGHLDITDSDGLDASTRELTLRALEADPKLGAVYSPGGGNRAILEAFEMTNRRCFAFIAHDLDRDNRQLLQTGRVSAVLHHDLRADMRRACQAIMQAHGALEGPIVSTPSPVHIVSPYNVPPADLNS